MVLTKEKENWYLLKIIELNNNIEKIICKSIFKNINYEFDSINDWYNWYSNLKQSLTFWIYDLENVSKLLIKTFINKNYKISNSEFLSVSNKMFFCGNDYNNKLAKIKANTINKLTIKK